MGKASAAFGRLHKSLPKNHHVFARVKCTVYRGLVIPTVWIKNLDNMSVPSKKAAW